MSHGILIATTSSSGLHPLGSGGQTARDAYRQIVLHLRRTLSDEHARLLAEPSPNRQRGTVDWFTVVEDVATRAEPFAALRPERRDAVEETLARLREEIDREATALAAARDPGQRLLGRLLAMALEVPAEDHVYAVGAQPVLVAWGHLADRKDAPRRLLWRMAPPRPRPAAARGTAGNAGASDQAALLASAPAPPRHATVLGLLLWLVFTGLVTAILYVLLSGCGVGLPRPAWLPPSPIVSLCPATPAGAPEAAAALEAERLRTELLEGRLEQQRLSLTDAAAACRRRAQTAAAAGAPPPG